MKFIHQSFRAALYLGVGIALSGCLSTTPHWDAHFGDSVRQITAMQTLNPQASLNTNPVAGIDGVAAQAAQKNYAKSFSTPTPPSNMFTIGVGAGAASQ